MRAEEERVAVKVEVADSSTFPGPLVGAGLVDAENYIKIRFDDLSLFLFYDTVTSIRH